jgi:hypothetical protein
MFVFFAVFAPGMNHCHCGLTPPMLSYFFLHFLSHASFLQQSSVRIRAVARRPHKPFLRVERRFVRGEGRMDTRSVPILSNNSHVFIRIGFIFIVFILFFIFEMFVLLRNSLTIQRRQTLKR